MPMGHFRWIVRTIFLVAICCRVITLPVIADDETGPQPWIRVAVGSGTTTVTITASGSSRVNYCESSRSLASYDAPRSYTFEISGGRVRYSDSNDTQSGGFSIVCLEDSGRLQYNGRSYRGVMRIVVMDDRLTCVNVLPIEEYLWGVVPCEVPSDWPVEALKSQAIAARTYSLRAMQQYPGRPFDVYSTTVDQVYRGAGSERQSTTEACRETAGLVCIYDGEPIIAYYHSSAGGWTASGAEMFGRDLPYLRPVPSRDAAVYRWSYQISTGELASSLRAQGHSLGTIQRVWVHRFSQEGRADEVKIVHSNGVLIVSGADLRSTLGPGNIRSTYFRVEGQAAPIIPDPDSSRPIEIPIPGFNPMERYSITHPQVLVPLPVATLLEECPIMSTSGSSYANRFTVIGSGDSIEYIGGYIWVAQPISVGDLDRGILENLLLPDEQENEGGSGPTRVENPDGQVGMPRNGSIVFVGHGFGHGVGMSQHGARILAENGRSCEQILMYFYSGVDLEKKW